MRSQLSPVACQPREAAGRERRGFEGNVAAERRGKNEGVGLTDRGSWWNAARQPPVGSLRGTDVVYAMRIRDFDTPSHGAVISAASGHAGHLEFPRGPLVHARWQPAGRNGWKREPFSAGRVSVGTGPHMDPTRESGAMQRKRRVDVTTVITMSCRTWALSSVGREHLPYKQEVAGSNPAAPIELTRFRSPDVCSLCLLNWTRNRPPGTPREPS